MDKQKNIKRLGLRLANLVLITTVLLFAIVLTPASARKPAGGSRYEEIDAYLQKEIKRAAIPGLAYGIVYRDQVVQMGAFGVADTHGRPVTPQTPFALGSIAKTFTALAIRQLIDEGKIELDAPVQRYIPWFQLADPEAAAIITIRQLLSHTSGLSWADGNRADFQDGRLSIEATVRKMDQLSPNRPVGSSREYCNLNFQVLGEVVQIISGQSYQQYIQENIYRPLKMEHSYLSNAEAAANGLSTGFQIWYGFPVPRKTDMPEAIAPSGFMISSVEDMSHYLIAYLNRGMYQGTSVLLPASSTATKKPAEWYDIEWNEYFETSTIYNEGQSGGSFSFNGAIQIMGEQSRGTYGVVILLNSNPGLLVHSVDSVSLINGMIDILLNKPMEKTSAFTKYIWYLQYGSIDLVVLALTALALFELITIRSWAIRGRAAGQSNIRSWLRTGIDLLAGLFGLAALPAWIDVPWRDLFVGYSELCLPLLGSGIILTLAAGWKIILAVTQKWRPSEKALSSLVLLIVILCCKTPTQAQARAISQRTSYEEIDAFVQAEMKAASIPGLAYAIVKGDKIEHMQGFGATDGSGLPVTPQTPFLIGSVGKVITALAIQQLVRAGEIDLDAPVQRYIPWFHLADERAAIQITIRHLLTHTSGLSTGDGTNLKYYQGGPYTSQGIVREMAQIYLDRPVGTSVEYSNLNYLLLGQVVEQVSGQSYEAYVQQHIFSPLQMQHSYLDIEQARQAGLAKGNRILFGFLSPLELPYPHWLMATGYHISTAEDMAHLLIAHLNQGQYGNISVLSPGSSHMQKIANQPVFYDVHWIGQADMPRYYTDSQGGTTLDYSACYYILPTFRSGVIVLTNANTAEATPTKNSHTIAFEILEMANGFALRSNAPSITTVYIGIDLLLFIAALLPITQILWLKDWRKRLAGQPVISYWFLFPVLLINIILPLTFFTGIPVLVSLHLVPGLSYWSGWAFALYTLPDIGYSLLAIAGLLFITGFVKVYWYFQVNWREGMR